MEEPEGHSNLNMNNAHISGTNVTSISRNVVVQSSAGIFIVAIVALAIVLPLVNKPDHSNSSAANQASTSISQFDSILSTNPSPPSISSPSASDTSPHPLVAISTTENFLSSIISSITTLTPTAVPSTRLQAPPATTSAPIYFSPGASCTTDSQCSPNICYTVPSSTTYCCGPSIMGCPGWTCTDPGHRDCKDPFTCNFQASTCG